MYRSTEKLLENPESKSQIPIHKKYLRKSAFGAVNNSFSQEEDEIKEAPPVEVQIETEKPSKPPIPKPRRTSLLNKDNLRTESDDCKVEKFKKDDFSQSTSISEKNQEVCFAESRKNTIVKVSNSDTTSKDSEIPLTAFVVNEKSKKKFLKSKTEYSSRDLETGIDSGSTIDEKTSTETNLEVLETRKKKKRKKNQKKSSNKDKENESEWNYEEIVGIYCHELDNLKFSEDIKEPRIRISWFDQNTGLPMKKTDSTRNVIQDNENVDFISSVISKGCKFRQVSYLCCVWEELLIFNEDIDLIKTGNSILFFEVIDLDGNGDFKTLCWSFLKPFLNNSFDNLNKRSKLQLYSFDSKRSLIQQSRNLNQLKKCPGSLLITVKALTPEITEDSQGKMRPKNVLEKELTDEVNFQPNKKIDVFDTSKIWANQLFKCPNEMVKSLKFTAKGSNFVKFNSSGRLVAITEIEEDRTSNIQIFSLLEVKFEVKLEGHSDLVYDMDWKPGEMFPQFLISASADRSILIWKIEESFEYSAQILPHLSFVYCCKFWSLQNQNFVISGGKDSIIRVWNISNPRPRICQQLTKSSGFILSVAVSKSMNFYSGDSDGRVLEWVWTGKEFKHSQTIFEDKSGITCLVSHPRIDKIYIGNLRGIIHSVDIETHVVLQRYLKGDQDRNKFFQFRLSSCGNFLVSAHQKNATCWNLMTDLEVSSFPFLKSNSGKVFSSLDVHPKGSMVIFTRYNTRECVLVTSHHHHHQIIQDNSKQQLNSIAPLKQFQSISLDLQKKIAVKNKLTEIMQKLDDVFLLPRLCDDEKESLSKDMQKEKRKIQEWLEKNESPRNSQSEEDVEEGTFTIKKGDDADSASGKSTGTFVIPRDEPQQPPPKPKRLFKQQKKEKSNGENSSNDEKNATFDIKPKPTGVDSDDDDTTISDSHLEEK